MRNYLYHVPAMTTRDSRGHIRVITRCSSDLPPNSRRLVARERGKAVKAEGGRLCHLCFR